MEKKPKKLEKKQEQPLDSRVSKIAEKIKALRKPTGLSQEDFANEHELPRVQYWRLENGANFRISSLLQILDIHKITLEEFFKGIK